MVFQIDPQSQVPPPQFQIVIEFTPLLVPNFLCSPMTSCTYHFCDHHKLWSDPPEQREDVQQSQEEDEKIERQDDACRVQDLGIVEEPQDHTRGKEDQGGQIDLIPVVE